MNIKTSEKLLVNYKRITPEILDWLHHRYPIYNYWQLLTMVVGFGSMSTCSLCNEAKVLANSFAYGTYCHKCIHSIGKFNDGEFYCLSESYDLIMYANSVEQLYEAIQKRIKVLENQIRLYYDQRKHVN